jgi:hypothetical protein
MTSGITRVFVAFLASLLVSAPIAPASGQTPSSLGFGARVRISHTDPCCRSPQVGTLVSVTADSLVVSTGTPQQPRVITLPRGTVTSLETGYDAGHYGWTGAGIGALTGLLAGVGIALGTDCEGDEYCEGFRPLIGVVSGSVLALGGMVIGGLIGHSVRRVTWVGVPIPTEFGLAPTRDGGLGVRFTLRL